MDPLPSARRVPRTSVRLEDHRPDLRADFVAVIEKAMDPDPLRRFRTAGAMLHALDGFARSAMETRSRADDKLMESKPRSRMTLMLKIVIRLVPVLVGMGLIAWIVRQIVTQVLLHEPAIPDGPPFVRAPGAR